MTLAIIHAYFLNIILINQTFSAFSVNKVRGIAQVLGLTSIFDNYLYSLILSKFDNLIEFNKIEGATLPQLVCYVSDLYKNQNKITRRAHRDTVVIINGKLLMVNVE